MSAQSFLVKSGPGDLPSAVGRALDAARGPRRTDAGAALVFVSGGLARQARAIGERVRERLPGFAAIVVPAAGVLADRGEVEREAGASGIVWSGARADVLVGGAGSHPERLVERPVGAPEGQAPRRRGARAIFVGPAWAREHDAGALTGPAEPGLEVFGAGAVADPVVVAPSGELLEAPVAALHLGGAAPLVEVSVAARVVGDFHAVEAVDERGLVERLDGEPALDRLSRVAQRPGARQVVLAAVRKPALEGRAEPWALRPIKGLDEGRRALRVPSVAPGDELAFALLDADAGRQGIDRTARAVAAAVRGAAPTFALLLTCAGRGSSFYGAPEVELRALRARLPGVPFAGMQSAFELAGAPDPSATLALHAAVLALFRAPS